MGGTNEHVHMVIRIVPYVGSSCRETLGVALRAESAVDPWGERVGSVCRAIRSIHMVVPVFPYVAPS